ncbi:beta-ketoacyl-ACP synthase III [Francisella adeliensis]|uniref:Beta-ketoacyl-[acyl-carrier-protein] synthase III n=1 Tax=Francisella adeliensis TaxID=2007306 RepID=A0A2Z4XZS9_9GAMM|nr:beta-ketoacyl-ACP synthase III [Francisella adeliensis]AXA34290.1 3-oxoacyl-ACP synthase [Francisella adeliensis]MBK2084933.1 ketoacyl-ACP synthase III [Francisella adeliensis]MBK2096236.1 ketoacyl-ACP synthase III [Francisella adeliensis]QIW12535.1 ketoacyl-ACP synthase III [Francisella adeliensis]QIW14408.1 ketoacyl-ACP synthase III [Francisella adeliensis]
MFAQILGTGSYLPEKILTNDDISKFVDTSDEWIKQRVGIERRHCANESETTTFMATQAAKKALESAQIDAQQIDAIIVATSTPDYIMPSTAATVQNELQIEGYNVRCFDVSAACSGFVYALDMAKQYIETQTCKNILVIGAEKMTRVLDWNDRGTCVLFGDGAGAVIVSQSEEKKILSSLLFTDGSCIDMLNVPNNLPVNRGDTVDINAHLIMEGNKVFKFAVSRLSSLAEQLITDAGITAADIDWLVPHQANYRILNSTAKKINMPMSKVITTLQDHGNTSAASIPLALDHAVKNNSIKTGETIISEAFGSGFVWGGFIAKM